VIAARLDVASHVTGSSLVAEALDGVSCVAIVEESLGIVSRSSRGIVIVPEMLYFNPEIILV
jgi:hypothetical protein